MPHALLADFKSILPKILAYKLGDLKALAITYANKEVNRIIEELKKTCPPPPVLKELQETVTQIKKLINTTNKNVQVFNKIPPAITPAIVAGTIAVEILSHMPIPSTIGIPPGPAGGVIFSVPVGVIQAQANRLVWLRKMVETLKNDQKAVKAMIGGFQGIFTPIEAKLAIIEELLARCLKNPNLSDKERKDIIDAIGENRSLKDTNSSTKGESYISKKTTEFGTKSGAAYTILIVAEKDLKTVIPRKKAIAKDYRDITVLHGPYSYAGDEQVLIDELKFRIDNQLP